LGRILEAAGAESKAPGGIGACGRGGWPGGGRRWHAGSDVPGRQRAGVRPAAGFFLPGIGLNITMASGGRLATTLCSRPCIGCGWL